MKKLLCMITAAAMLLLTGCGSSPASSADVQAPESGVSSQETPAESVPAAEVDETALIQTCLERLFDCATLPEGAEITPEWLAEAFPECTDTARQECIYQKGVAAVMLFPNAIPGAVCRYAPAEITVMPEGDSYAYQAILDVTDGTCTEVTLTGRVQTDDAGLISYISFDDITSGGERLMGGMLEVYGPIAPPAGAVAAAQ